MLRLQFRVWPNNRRNQRPNKLHKTKTSAVLRLVCCVRQRLECNFWSATSNKNRMRKTKNEKMKKNKDTIELTGVCCVFFLLLLLVFAKRWCANVRRCSLSRRGYVYYSCCSGSIPNGRWFGSFRTTPIKISCNCLFLPLLVNVCEDAKIRSTCCARLHRNCRRSFFFLSMECFLYCFACRWCLVRCVVRHQCTSDLKVFNCFGTFDCCCGRWSSSAIVFRMLVAQNYTLFSVAAERFAVMFGYARANRQIDCFFDYFPLFSSFASLTFSIR